MFITSLLLGIFFHPLGRGNSGLVNFLLSHEGEELHSGQVLFSSVGLEGLGGGQNLSRPIFPSVESGLYRDIQDSTADVLVTSFSLERAEMCIAGA